MNHNEKDVGLKPCPFCGSSIIFFEEVHDDIYDVNSFEIDCGGCQIAFSCGDSTKEEIAELWNRRDEE